MQVFPGGLAVRTLSSDCSGHRFDPWSSNLDPISCLAQLKNKRERERELSKHLDVGSQWNAKPLCWVQVLMVCAIRDTRSLLLNPSLGTMLPFIQHPFSWLMRLTPIDLSPGSTCWHIQAEPFGGPFPCHTPSKALTPACLGLAFPKATATLSSLRARNVSHLLLFPHNGAHFRYQMFNDYWVNE